MWKQNIGYCANCNKENIEYGSQVLCDNNLYYLYHCEDCGYDGKEWFELKYIESE